MGRSCCIYIIPNLVTLITNDNLSVLTTSMENNRKNYSGLHILRHMSPRALSVFVGATQEAIADPEPE